MRADRSIHATQLGQAGPRRNNRHSELLVRIADFNRLHPVGSIVWVEDGSEHRHRAHVNRSAFIDNNAAKVGLASIDLLQFTISLDDVKDIPA